MDDRTCFVARAQLAALLMVVACAAPALAATRIDDYELSAQTVFKSGFDNKSTQRGVETERLRAVQPLTFSATKIKGTSTSTATLNAALLYDGSRLTAQLNPGTSITQFRPIGNKPATMALKLDELELETEDRGFLNGLVFSDFTLRGTVATGGYARFVVNLDLEAEGPGTDIGRHISFDRTFTANFEQTASQLFGANGIFGVDLSNRRLEELSLEGSIKFEVLGSASGTSTLEILEAVDLTAAAAPITRVSGKSGAVLSARSETIDLAAVPEPASWIVFGLACALLAAHERNMLRRPTRH